MMRKSFRARVGVVRQQGHHVRWLSRGGNDALANMVLICQNHHRAIHRIDAPFDFAAGGFLVDNDIEHLALLHHELAA